MPDNTGTLRSIIIGGPTYDVAADADISVDFTQFDVEGVATSGKPVFKYTKKLETAESIPAMFSSAQIEDIRLLAESGTDIQIGFETVDGILYLSTGRISMGKWTSAEGRCEITMLPVDPWALF